MNGPRQSLENQTIELDQDIWSSTDIGSDGSVDELRAAARRLQERLVLCGCLDGDNQGNWVRSPSRRQSILQ